MVVAMWFGDGGGAREEGALMRQKRGEEEGRSG